MRILDPKTDKALNQITVYLTPAEAREFISKLRNIIDGVGAGSHEHIPSEDFKKEITICTYDPAVLEGFDERSIKLITEDR